MSTFVSMVETTSSGIFDDNWACKKAVGKVPYKKISLLQKFNTYILFFPPC